jgi:hypothetical protein
MQAETGIGEGRGIPVDGVLSGLGGELTSAAIAQIRSHDEKADVLAQNYSHEVFFCRHPIASRSKAGQRARYMAMHDKASNTDKKGRAARASEKECPN